jgi:hypothetical protein
LHAWFGRLHVTSTNTMLDVSLFLKPTIAAGMLIRSSSQSSASPERRARQARLLVQRSGLCPAEHDEAIKSNRRKLHDDARVYNQWLIAYGFGGGGILPALDFGYSEGTYEATSGPAEFSSAVDRYETVPLLNGSGGIGEEKFLIVGIGGDADMFYGLVHEFSPERVPVLVPQSERHGHLDLLLNQQVAKVTEMHRLQEEEVRRVNSFAIQAYLAALEEYSTKVGDRAVISVFAGGRRFRRSRRPFSLEPIDASRSRLAFRRAIRTGKSDQTEATIGSGLLI